MRSRRRLLTLVGVAVGVGVLAGAGAVMGPFVWPADPDAALRPVAGRLVGEATGYVTGVDADERVLKVSASVFGWRPLSLSVGDDTTIRIRDKQGGLGDLALDMPVRVVYEIDGQTRRATSVELLGTRGESAAANSITPELTPRADADPVSQPEKPPLAVPANPPAMKATPTVVEASAASERGNDQPGVVRSAAPPSRPAPKADPPALARRPATPAPPSRVIDEGGADGSAAIDWLLDASRRR